MISDRLGPIMMVQIKLATRVMYLEQQFATKCIFRNFLYLLF
jgi:hypothetical protein